VAANAGSATRRKRAGKGGPNPVDVHVGARVRLRRTLLGMSQEKLAKAVSLTFQQIQKYERGSNRIGASRLFQFAQVLDVPVSFFYDDMPDDVDGAKVPVPGAPLNGEAFEQDQLARRETLELVRAYYRIADPTVRRRVFELTKTLSRSEERRAKRL
jgi:transcriptional regulator with XRE-family HTH domain